MIHCCYAAIDDDKKEVFSSNNIKIISNDKLNYNERGFDRRKTSHDDIIGIENAEFNLQTRGPDGIVYGCIGHIDRNGDFLPQLYLIDALGFRLVNSSNIAVASKFKYTITIYLKIYALKTPLLIHIFLLDRSMI